MAGGAEIKNAWSMAQGARKQRAWSMEFKDRLQSGMIRSKSSASSSAASHCAVYDTTKGEDENAKTFKQQRSAVGKGDCRFRI